MAFSFPFFSSFFQKRATVTDDEEQQPIGGGESGSAETTTRRKKRTVWIVAIVLMLVAVGVGYVFFALDESVPGFSAFFDLLSSTPTISSMGEDGVQETTSSSSQSSSWTGQTTTATAPEQTNNNNNVNRPPLSDLIQKDSIVGDVQFLLDFALIGQPGDTGLQELFLWLKTKPRNRQDPAPKDNPSSQQNDHSSPALEIHFLHGNIKALQKDRPAELVDRLYTELPATRWSTARSSSSPKSSSTTESTFSQVKHGYKAPSDLSSPTALKHLKTYFPSTKLIVGVRHPIEWFQVDYNDKLKVNENNDEQPKNKKGIPLLQVPPEVLHHVSLNLLGKISPQDLRDDDLDYDDDEGNTDDDDDDDDSGRSLKRTKNEVDDDDAMDDDDDNALDDDDDEKEDDDDGEEEDEDDDDDDDYTLESSPVPGMLLLSILSDKKKYIKGAKSNENTYERLDLPNPVFFYDAAQVLFDSNDTRRQAFQRDLQTFLSIGGGAEGEGSGSGSLSPNTLRPLPPPRAQLWRNETFSSAFSICDRSYSWLRTELLIAGRAAALWIKSYFLDASNVTVSSPEYLNALLDDWSVDPCYEYPTRASGVVTATSSVETAKPSRRDQYPPLNQLVDLDTGRIVGKVQFLLDFGIVGHSKTATSTLMRWLSTHPEIAIYRKELTELVRDKPAEFVQKLYLLPPGKHYKRGYKSPLDIVNPSSRNLLRTYFRQTKLIVGVRHPVWWLESHVNFKTRMGQYSPSVADDYAKDDAVLSNRVRFHTNLALMGKTNLSDPEELALLEPYLNTYDDWKNLRRMPNPVFLYDSAQPFDLENSTRKALFREDLSNFLGLALPLQDVHESVDNSNGSATYVSANYHYVMDICEAKYDNLRAKLIELGRVASMWILTYFIKHPDVTVSSPDFFFEQLRSWQFDPCLEGN